MKKAWYEKVNPSNPNPPKNFAVLEILRQKACEIKHKSLVYLQHSRKKSKKKKLCRNHATNSLSWPFWRISRRAYTPSSPREESITGDPGCCLHINFFLLERWIKWIVLFIQLKVMFFYLSHFYVSPCI